MWCGVVCCGVVCGDVVCCIVLCCVVLCCVVVCCDVVCRGHQCNLLRGVAFLLLLTWPRALDTNKLRNHFSPACSTPILLVLLVGVTRGSVALAVVNSNDVVSNNVYKEVTKPIFLGPQAR